MFAQKTEYWPMFPYLLPNNLHLAFHTLSPYLYIFCCAGFMLFAHAIEKRLDDIHDSRQDETLIDDIEF